MLVPVSENLANSSNWRTAYQKKSRSGKLAREKWRVDGNMPSCENIVNASAYNEVRETIGMSETLFRHASMKHKHPWFRAPGKQGSTYAPNQELRGGELSEIEVFEFSSPIPSDAELKDWLWDAAWPKKARGCVAIRVIASSAETIRPS